MLLRETNRRSVMAYGDGIFVLILLSSFGKGCTENVQCSREKDCTNCFEETSVTSCCVQEGIQAFLPREDSETCLLCFVYGWVDEITPDGESASPQSVVTAEEGETITLNIYYTKNGLTPPGGFEFNIETGGNATLNADYTLSHATPLILFQGPTHVNVTLLNDRVAGEGMETIILTLNKVSGTENMNIILEYSVAVINLKDNDIVTGFEVSEITIREGNFGKMCLTTVGPLFYDAVINVTLMEGSAGRDDIHLHIQKLTLTAVNPEPCISFIALADNLGLEGQEMLTLSLSAPFGIIVRNSSLTVNIRDGDVVEFEFNDSDKIGSEGTGVITVRVLQSVATAIPITLKITLNEYSDHFGFDVPDSNPNSFSIATPGDDYITDIIKVVVPAGNGPTDVPIPIVDDEIKENLEQYFVGVLGISGDSIGAQIGTRNTTLLIITDDEKLFFQFEELSYDVEEGDTNITYNLVLNKSLESEETYTLGIEGISNTAGDEDFSIPSKSIVFPANVQNINIPVTIIGDMTIELTEQFNVMVHGMGFPLVVVNLNATINIIDNDGSNENGNHLFLKNIMIVILITVAVVVVSIVIAIHVIVCIVYWRRKKRRLGLNPTPATEHIYDVPNFQNCSIAPTEDIESLAMKHNSSYSPMYPTRAKNSKLAMTNPAFHVGREVQNCRNAPTKSTESLAMKDNLSYSPVLLYSKRSRNVQLPMTNPAFYVGTADLEMVRPNTEMRYE